MLSLATKEVIYNLNENIYRRLVGLDESRIVNGRLGKKSDGKRAISVLAVVGQGRGR